MALSVGLGILTFNIFETGRETDFQATWQSTEREWCGHNRKRVLLTNGSTDGTQDLVRDLGGIVDDTNDHIYYGNNRLVEELSDCDIVVLSADDLLYHPNWLHRLVRFMEAAPERIALCSAYVEPLWEWNPVTRVAIYGGERALVRQSVCGSSWAFRSKDWGKVLGPLPDLQGAAGEDLEVCQQLRSEGREMAALDLSEHVGQERSAWGNESHLTARPLDTGQWGL